MALLDLIFKLQYLMNYSSNFNNFCRFQLLAVCTTLLYWLEGQNFGAPIFTAFFLKYKQCFMKTLSKMIPTTRITTQQWVSHTAPTLSMYHSQNSSFITLWRFEESSISEVLVWQCNIKTMQNPTNIVDLCPSGQEVYFTRERWQVQSL